MATAWQYLAPGKAVKQQGKRPTDLKENTPTVDLARGKGATKQGSPLAVIRQQDHATLICFSCGDGGARWVAFQSLDASPLMKR